ncbi:hypothetical protein [Falsiroseomonas sp. CW058]|uniref:hypothetical protein n=1 Tax=Falsiroseomonas sp. CW058 TaxID=3388664 RepID=UPI003D30FDD4
MDQDATPKLRRRLLVLRLGAIPSAALLAPRGSEARVAMAPQGGAAPVQGWTDSDPSDGPGRGRGPRRGGTGISDSDPSDGPGQGRGAARGSGVTDNDPSDGPGRGRGGRGSGISDSDPSDGPGRGRGRNTGLTDSDPSDGPGQGRRGR